MYVSTLYQKRVLLLIMTVCLYVVSIDCLVLSIIMYVRMQDNSVNELYDL